LHNGDRVNRRELDQVDGIGPTEDSMVQEINRFILCITNGAFNG